MKDSKIISLLKSFETREFTRLRKYIQSPFFLRHQKLKMLANCIFSFAPAYNSVDLNKESLFGKIFPGQQFDEYKFNNLISDLYQHIENFLTHVEFENDPVQQNKYLLTQLIERNQNKAYRQAIRRGQLHIQNTSKGADYYYHQYLLAERADEFFMKQGTRKPNKYLQLKSDNHEISFLVNKLKDACEMINRSFILKQDFDLGLAPALISWIDTGKNNYLDYPPVLIYYTVYRMLKEFEDETHFRNLVVQLEEYPQVFSDEENRQLYDLAQNYCIRQINSGNTDYLNEIFKIYKTLLKSKLIFERNFLSQWDYKNIITVGIRLKEFSWTEKFIHDYKNQMEPEYRENAFIYNLSVFYYSTGRYREAQDLLLNIEFSDIFYSLGAKTTLFKIYYDTMEKEAFFNLSSTFKVYLHRNKLISSAQATTYKNMIKYTGKALLLKMNKNFYSTEKYSNKLMKLKSELDKAKSVANINWVREIISQL